MKLFVGLGNPGGKYERNRHNIGFMALDQIASDHGFSPWKSKFQAQVSEGKLGSEKSDPAEAADLYEQLRPVGG